MNESIRIMEDFKKTLQELKQFVKEQGKRQVNMFELDNIIRSIVFEQDFIEAITECVTSNLPMTITKEPIQKECMFCHKMFFTHRKHAKFCSSICSISEFNKRKVEGSEKNEDAIQ